MMRSEEKSLTTLPAPPAPRLEKEGMTTLVLRGFAFSGKGVTVGSQPVPTGS